MNDTDVNNKYDRQVRLWNVSGQRRLVDSRVCFVGASPVACETAKNLVLPGVGKLVFVDDLAVDSSDLAANFFLQESDLHKDRARCVSDRLGELNADSSLEHVNTPWDQLIQDKGFWKQFDCVVNARLDPDTDLIDVLWQLGVPLVHIHATGVYSLVRVYSLERTIVETHATRADDFRLDAAWPELQTYVDSIDSHAAAEVPYSVLLIKTFQELEKKLGRRPTTRETRERLRELGDDDNVLEAVKKAALVGKESHTLDDRTRQLLAQKPSLATATMFWVLVEALDRFYQKHRLLPLNGSLPDMTSNTDRYLELQDIYRAKHDADKTELRGLATQVLAEHDRANETVTDAEMDLFVKNCNVLEVQRGSKNVWDPKTLEDENSPVLQNINIYFGFLALNAFHKQHGRYPTPADQAEVRSWSISELCRHRTVKSFPDGLEHVLDELLRAKGEVLHNVCALTGGIAAQEIIKVLTNQYVPLNNTLTFDGIRGQTGTWKID
ncbi:hypothetical protein OGAPHI_002157 [Ogataea philodendri]|uniref:NEDD8-activating enzyme E1 regulatory subunit n=1 Tax=Ogataea philodendri TaxID=1378263 RepID=A0A9P8T6R9_9ASCO|nr:uncharacterized protein OGAPHI_002157 [Ogataea philodendri]KAH3668403.1 hypothetical protein OGAPHI_002157 [Ogataea philodendri]